MWQIEFVFFLEHYLKKLQKTTQKLTVTSLQSSTFSWRCTIPTMQLLEKSVIQKTPKKLALNFALSLYQNGSSYRQTHRKWASSGGTWNMQLLVALACPYKSFQHAAELQLHVETSQICHFLNDNFIINVLGFKCLNCGML